MKIAIATLCIGEYEKGAHVLFSTLEKYGGLPDSVDRYAVGIDECEYATAIPLKNDYSWIPVNQQHFPTVAGKFQALNLQYDRIILLDSDMLCVGDCSLLWSNYLGKLPFYAVRDVASNVYYHGVIESIGLNHNLLFNAGTMVFSMNLLGDDFHNCLLEEICDGVCSSYDGGDQGYLNHYFQLHKTEIGFLPMEYNVCADPHWPKLDVELTRLVHFTGSNANPWSPNVGNNDPRQPLFQRWQHEYERLQR